MNPTLARRSDAVSGAAGWQDVMMPDRRHPCVTALICAAAVIALAACGDDEPASDTPRISVSSESALTERMLRPDDVAIIAGFEGAEAQDLEELSIFENPDPRGPCGGAVILPPFDDAAGRALTGTSIGLVQTVAPSSSELDTYVDALIDDSEPPCDVYRSTTNTGDTQTVSEIVVYDATGEDVRGVAWTNLVQIDEGSVYAGVIALQTDDVTTFLQIRSASQIPAEGMQVLTEAAVLRLQDR